MVASQEDVTLGHERRPIPIDLSRVGGAGGPVGRELLSRLRRFVYIRDCIGGGTLASLIVRLAKRKAPAL